ncbi:MAG: hypothetical protein OEW04_14750, partial [Nitrospirota bacterium]|nr:hypothetical protein [Nitrospirota bacterium]
GTATAQIGLMGSDLPDEKREWWSRLGGWLCIFMLAWIVPFGFVLTALPLLLWGKAYFTAAAATGWLFSTLAGVWSGKSPLTGKGESGRTELIARIAPYVFAFGLLLFSAAILFGSFIYENVAQLNDVRNGFLSFILTEKIPFHDLMLTYLYYMNFTLNGGLLIFFLSCLVLAVLLSCRLDINQFSMHLLYRNRLTRCYLGASNKPRNPQPFTGLDPGDDFPINELSQSRSYFGPYPIINSTLNLVGSRELAWQTRKAVSFVSTPRFCGYELPAEEEKDEEKEKAGCYRVTKGRAQNGGGVLLGEAMTVSGAAASPNMGYHSSPPLAFLMTIFNVRLGWWVRNTRYGGMENKGPKMGLRYLMAELFGLTDNESGYVYLSDGGHFENLGIYELVRRRCNVIVASDASCDPNYTFEDLGNAIRKIRVDLGIPVEIDLSPLRPGNNSDRKYCAVGTIHYKCVDGADVEDGKLIYIKPLLTGINEPADVSNYASLHKDFPHQSTADQWFDESQFESYRMLGYHSVKAIVNYSPLSDDANEGLKMLLQGGRSSFSVRHDFL